MIKSTNQKRNNSKTWFVPHSFPERGRVISHGAVPEWVRGKRVGWGSGGDILRTKPLSWPPLKGLGEAEQAASGLASLVSFSRLWGTVTVLVVQSPGVQVSGPGFQKGRWRVAQRVRAPQRRWLAWGLWIDWFEKCAYVYYLSPICLL